MAKAEREKNRKRLNKDMTSRDEIIKDKEEKTKRAKKEAKKMKKFDEKMADMIAKYKE